MNPGTRIFLIAAMLAATLWSAVDAQAQFASFPDAVGDAVPRRTDDDCDGPFDPETQRLPDLVTVEINSFTPAAPHIDRFTGNLDASGMFIRIDVVFDGLVNPPGSLGYDDEPYAPDTYGPNPVFGYIEFDIDGNENTGGEVEYPRFRYLSNAARFGGLPGEARFDERAAVIRDDIDHNIDTAPFVERSGEEFHIALIDVDIDYFDVIVENPSGNAGTFDAGETWWIEGEFFHRAHVYDGYTVSCQSGNDRYEPELPMQFSHDEVEDKTTLTLVIPKTNAAAASLNSPSQSTQPNDGCDFNQYSIEEAVTDMIISATVAGPFTRMESAFQLIADWEFQTTAPSLDPANWRISALVGTAYLPIQADDDELIWSDIYPNVIAGDVNGDSIVDDMDEMDINAFITTFDGVAFIDDDGDNANGSVDLFDWGNGFCVYDVNYDGFINGSELSTDLIAGDFNLDGLVDGRDIAGFVLALIDPVAYSTMYPSADLLIIGDLNGDQASDLDDLNGLLFLMVGPQPEPIVCDLNNDQVVDFADVPAFSMALTNPSVYQDTFGLDPIERADINQDGTADGRDIVSFIEKIVP